LKPAFENILGEAEREKYPNLVAWYGTVSSDGKLKKHLKTQMTKERKQYDAKEVAGKLAKEEEKARKKAEKEAKFAAKKRHKKLLKLKKVLNQQKIQSQKLKRRRKKKSLNIQNKPQKVKRKVQHVLFQSPIVRSMLKQLGVNGGKNKACSNLNMDEKMFTRIIHLDILRL